MGFSIRFPHLKIPSQLASLEPRRTAHLEEIIKGEKDGKQSQPSRSPPVTNKNPRMLPKGRRKETRSRKDEEKRQKQTIKHHRPPSLSGEDQSAAYLENKVERFHQRNHHRTTMIKRNPKVDRQWRSIREARAIAETSPIPPSLGGRDQSECDRLDSVC